MPVPGLHDEVAAGVDRLGDELGHLLLAGAVLGVRAAAAGDASASAERRDGSAAWPRHGDEGERGVELGGVEVGPGLCR